MGKNMEGTMANPFAERSAELHALTRAEEEACFKDLKAKALKLCSAPIKEFVECSKEHNITVMWTCRSKLKEMNHCLNQYTSREQLDKLKLAKLAAKRDELSSNSAQ